MSTQKKTTVLPPANPLSLGTSLAIQAGLSVDLMITKAFIAECERLEKLPKGMDEDATRIILEKTKADLNSLKDAHQENLDRANRIQARFDKHDYEEQNPGSFSWQWDGSDTDDEDSDCQIIDEFQDGAWKS